MRGLEKGIALPEKRHVTSSPLRITFFGICIPPMVINETILLQIEEDLIQFTLHLLPIVLPIIKKDLQQLP